MWKAHLAQPQLNYTICNMLWFDCRGGNWPYHYGLSMPFEQTYNKIKEGIVDVEVGNFGVEGFERRLSFIWKTSL